MLKKMDNIQILKRVFSSKRFIRLMIALLFSIVLMVMAFVYGKLFPFNIIIICIYFVYIIIEVIIHRNSKTVEDILK